MIKKAKDTDLDEIVILALELWPENPQEDLTQEMSEILHNAESAFFLAYAKNRSSENSDDLFSLVSAPTYFPGPLPAKYLRRK